jgi:hypothetical protein
MVAEVRERESQEVGAVATAASHPTNTPENFPRERTFWKCPRTGLVVPKKTGPNLEWRTKLLRDAASDEGLQRALYTACAISPIFWINAFVWTYRQKIVDPRTGRERTVTGNEAHVPFITWEIQEKGILDVERCMDIKHAGDGSQDAIINKSRDMGATWIVVTMFHHAWTFVDNVNILWVSATASDVDMHPTINPDTIFYKHDYINYWMPAWMRPPVHRRNMHLGNKLRGNSLDGEATTANVGRGGRRTAIGFDEFAAVEDGEGMLSASSDTTPCRIFNSTPKGPGTAFTNIYKHALAGTKQVKLIQLPWWEHPEKGRGRYLVEDEQGNRRYSSKWYELECLRRSSPQEIAQNLDMNHMDSGSRFFDGPVLARHTSSYCRTPDFTATLDFRKKLRVDEMEKVIARGDKRGVGIRRTDKFRPWKFWMQLIDHRPDQAFNYIIGVDIGNGQGASNSTMSVRCKETGEKVAAFANARTPPHDLARLAAVAGIWFGSASGGFALIVPEANGPGGIFITELKRLGYPNIYLERRANTTDVKQTNRLGWHSSRERKELLLGTYRRELARDQFINHDTMAVEEAEEYIYYDTGAVGPARLITENEGARATHGDRVIADALTCVGGQEVSDAKVEEPTPPGNSYASRRERRRAAAKHKADRWRGRRQRR